MERYKQSLRDRSTYNIANTAIFLIFISVFVLFLSLFSNPGGENLKLTNLDHEIAITK